MATTTQRADFEQMRGLYQRAQDQQAVMLPLIEAGHALYCGLMQTPPPDFAALTERCRAAREAYDSRLINAISKEIDDSISKEEFAVDEFSCDDDPRPLL
jgi:hypothetical protein